MGLMDDLLSGFEVSDQLRGFHPKEIPGGNCFAQKLITART
jgi:hypothetical protein